MKFLIPLLIALVGLGAGVGAGLVLKPEPEPEPSHEAAADCGQEHGEPCQTAEADPFKTTPVATRKHDEELTYVPMEKPFVVPVFSGEKVVAMIVVSLSLETDLDGAHVVEAVQPRLRDSFLKALFRHANSGGFDGSFTAGQKMEDLKSALLQAGKTVMGEAMVGEVLITEIARQDV
jgi:hypothetical protein